MRLSLYLLWPVAISWMIGSKTVAKARFAVMTLLPQLKFLRITLHGFVRFRSDVTGQRFFVYAGIDPEKPHDQQGWQDLLWMRRQQVVPSPLAASDAFAQPR
jgi:hypothetical protein